ncbi:MAG TPA: hypothetical protein VK447_18370 [Myxococcaceae bacterium]|nr:hypothetical protein [Myxococcaceae bacterium]
MAARSRSQASQDLDDRDDDNFRDEVSVNEDVAQAFPQKRSSPFPWFLLAVVTIFSASAGYLGYTKLMEQQQTIQNLVKSRDEAVAKIQKAEAEVAGSKAAHENLQKQISDLEAKLKEQSAGGQVVSASGTAPADATTTAAAKEPESKATSVSKKKSTTRKKKSTRR